MRLRRHPLITVPAYTARWKPRQRPAASPCRTRRATRRPIPAAQPCRIRPGTRTRCSAKSPTSTPPLGERGRQAGGRVPAARHQPCPIGTGPYKLTSYKPGESIGAHSERRLLPVQAGRSADPDPDHQGPDAAADASSRATSTSTTRSSRRTPWPSSRLIRTSSCPSSRLGYYYFAFNVRPGHVFADRAAQDAVKMCIDPKPTVAAATDNNGVPVKSFVPPGSYYYDRRCPTTSTTSQGPRSSSKAPATPWVLMASTRRAPSSSRPTSGSGRDDRSASSTPSWPVTS